MCILGALAEGPIASTAAGIAAFQVPQERTMAELESSWQSAGWMDELPGSAEPAMPPPPPPPPPPAPSLADRVKTAVVKAEKAVEKAVVKATKAVKKAARKTARSTKKAARKAKRR